LNGFSILKSFSVQNNPEHKYQVYKELQVKLKKIVKNLLFCNKTALITIEKQI